MQHGVAEHNGDIIKGGIARGVSYMVRLKVCHDCGAKPGEHHEYGCDTEQCAMCGGQAISCGCIYEVNGMNQSHLREEHPDIYHNGPTDEMYDIWDKKWGAKRLPWTGRWPGEVECQKFGWYAKLIPGQGWVTCSKDDPEATPDLNRLHATAKWDIDLQKFVLTPELAEA